MTCCACPDREYCRHHQLCAQQIHNYRVALAAPPCPDCGVEVDDDGWCDECAALTFVSCAAEDV